MVDLYCASYPRPPAAVTLDIDDTLDVVLNAHHDERCLLPIHVYDTATSRLVMVLLWPSKTPSGQEVRGHLRRLVRRIQRHWPRTHITLRGDGHYGRPEVIAFCEAEAIDYVSSLPTNAVLRAAVEDAGDDVRVRRAEEGAPDELAGAEGAMHAPCCVGNNKKATVSARRAAWAHRHLWPRPARPHRRLGALRPARSRRARYPAPSSRGPRQFGD
jgi:hypothetical protein